MDWLSGISGWSGLFTLLFKGDTLLVLMAGTGLAGVLIAALRSKAPPILRLAALLIAAAFFGAVLAWVLGWIG